MKVKIGNRWVGENEPCFVTADIGINANGSLETAKELIKQAYLAGVDAVKFQKRTVDKVYSPEELLQPRESRFGKTNGDLKRALEFGYEDYCQIDDYCKFLGLAWYASAWDIESVDFLEQFNLPCHKVASAMVTNIPLLKRIKETGKPVILSTGMSTLEEIDRAVGLLPCDLIILHSTSTYPTSIEELNLNLIPFFKKCYEYPVGYSGHEVGLDTTVVAVALGAKMVERHITLNRAMWGSDQAASVEPLGFQRLVRHIHDVEMALGDGIKRVYESEIPVMRKLRKV